jgi:hypothetical protein
MEIEQCQDHSMCLMHVSGKFVSNELYLFSALLFSIIQCAWMFIGVCDCFQGFRYAAAQYASYCFCGNSYDRYGPADNCDMACSGDSSVKCGGGYANTVIDTGLGMFIVIRQLHFSVSYSVCLNLMTLFTRGTCRVHCVCIPLMRVELMKRFSSRTVKTFWCCCRWHGVLGKPVRLNRVYGIDGLPLSNKYKWDDALASWYWNWGIILAVDPCSTDPCQKGGTCTSNANGSYSRSCLVVWTSKKCNHG